MPAGWYLHTRAKKTLYIAGDTVWVKPYMKNLQRFQPEIVVLNAGYAG